VTGDGAAAPSVSVVVPVRDRRALLRDLLDALAAQTLTDHEVIVVDDGSTDGSGEEARADADAGRPVRLVRTPGVGAYAARQRGVVVARAPYLAFTDSDCVPSPTWLERGVAALDAGADVVAGLTLPERPAGPLERTMASGPEGLYPTCNVFYRRAAFSAAGGFDLTAGDRFGFRRHSTARRMGFGEDTLLAWRVRRNGGRAVHVPEALVTHRVLPGEPADLLRRAVMMHAFPALVREVPELADGPLVRHRVVLTGGRRLPLHAALAAAALRRWRVAGLALGWWAAATWRDLRPRPGRRREKLAAMPALLALEAAAAVALATGSLRFRRVLL
jgi:hypothetical protein